MNDDALGFRVSLEEVRDEIACGVRELTSEQEESGCDGQTW